MNIINYCSDIDKRLKKLEHRICCNKIEFSNTMQEFPIIGDVNNIYIDRETGKIYIFDNNSSNYVILNRLYIDTNTGTVYIWKDNSYITANTDIAASLKTVNGISLDGPGDISFSGVNIEIVDNFSNLPDPSSALNLFYFCSNSQGTQWLPGSVGK